MTKEGGLMLSVHTQEALKILHEYDKKLTAYDFGKKQVQIIHEDGSVFFLDSAFLVEIKLKNNIEYIGVLAEHHIPMAFCKEDLYSWKQFVIDNDIIRLGE